MCFWLLAYKVKVWLNYQRLSDYYSMYSCVLYCCFVETFVLPTVRPRSAVPVPIPLHLDIIFECAQNSRILLDEFVTGDLTMWSNTTMW